MSRPARHIRHAWWAMPARAPARRSVAAPGVVLELEAQQVVVPGVLEQPERIQLGDHAVQGRALPLAEVKRILPPPAGCRLAFMSAPFARGRARRPASRPGAAPACRLDVPGWLRPSSPTTSPPDRGPGGL